MSKIILQSAGHGTVSHVVETADGKQYAVCSTKVFDNKYRPFETAVFRWNKVVKDITNWIHLVRSNEETEEEMLITHELMCKNLEAYLA